MSATNTDEVTLVVEGEQIVCSRQALLQISEYFRAMFCGGMKEASASSIVMEDVSLHCMKWLVVYSKDRSKHKFEDVNDACDILHTACILQCLEVLEIASKYIIARLSSDNCLGVMCLADQHALNNLYNVSRRKALWDFLLVRTSPEFLCLDKDFLIDYLSCDTLNIHQESEVLDAVIQWLEYDQNREDLTDLVLASCVRLRDIGCSNLQQYLANTTVLANSDLHSAILQAIDLNLPASQPSRQIPHELWLTGEWSPAADAVTKLACVHGDLQQLDRKFELLDNLPINNPHPQAHGRAVERAGFTVTVVGKDMYIMGGGSVSSSKLQPDCWRYDTFRAVWTDVGDMPIPRRHHSTVLVQGHFLWMIGGFGNYRIMLDSVLSYDTRTGEWSNEAALNNAVYCSAVCECEDYIYVIKHHIERYNIHSKHWQEVGSALPFEIGLHSAVSVDHKIYMLGKNICSLVCFDSRTLTFDTLATFPPYVRRLAPVLCWKDNKTLLIVSAQRKEEEEEEEQQVKTIIEEFNIKQKTVLKHYDLGWAITNPQVVLVPHYPAFR